MLAAAWLLLCICAALASPVVVGVRLRVRGCALLAPRVRVHLLWGLVRLRPRVKTPRFPLRHLAERLGIPLPGAPARKGAGPPRHARTGHRSPLARHAAAGLHHVIQPSPAAAYLFGPPRRVHVRRLRLELVLATGDPARTGIAAGAAWGLLGGAVAALPAYVRFEGAPRVEVRPVFRGRPQMAAQLDCILAARLGQIMAAALASIVHRRGRAERNDRR